MGPPLALWGLSGVGGAVVEDRGSFKRHGAESKWIPRGHLFDPRFQPRVAR